MYFPTRWIARVSVFPCRKIIVEEIKKFFKLKVTKSTNDYLSCEIHFNQEKSRAWIGQPHLVKKLGKEFGEMVQKLKKYKTPGTPKLKLVRPKEEDEVLSRE